MKVRSKWLCLLIGLFTSQVLFAGTVRTVSVNNGAMAAIYLRMGKSTVLRFSEKPKKVVVGNQNYYGLEFIENDLAIQPLGAVATNLFVYTQNHTYGFLLTPGERYDDLVFVRWKYDLELRAKDDVKPKPTKITLPNLSFKLGNNLKIVVTKIQGPSTLGLHIIDCSIENLGKEDMSIIPLLLAVERGGKALSNQNTVIESDRLKPGNKTRARILLKLQSKEDFSIVGRFEKISAKIIVGRKYL